MSTLSKEEILDKQLGDFTASMLSTSDILKAMEIYAKQEAIEYQKWLTLNGWEISTKHPEKWYDGSVIPYVYLDYKEVYQLYLKSKQP